MKKIRVYCDSTAENTDTLMTSGIQNFVEAWNCDPELPPTAMGKLIYDNLEIEIMSVSLPSYFSLSDEERRVLG
jgi:hypothetical protein